MNEIKQRIEALDTSLYEVIPHQLLDSDCRALLGLHVAVASVLGSFTYLEIGSYLGGSLQVLIRDPDCTRIISIDPRFSFVRDKRIPEWEYENNTTQHMMSRLRRIPGADTTKLVTLDVRSEDIRMESLPGSPDFCFIDGEHTDEAVFHDAELCMTATEGEGVIAFHDYSIVQPGIRSFLRAHWDDIASALAFTGAVFAVEVGDRGILRSAVIDRAVASTWHSAAWRAASRWRSPHPLLAIWAAMPHLDALIFEGRRRLRLSRRG
jgi:Methyltransferase domain